MTAGTARELPRRSRTALSGATPTSRPMRSGISLWADSPALDGGARAKRAVDLLASCALLAVLGPLMLLIAGGVLVTSHGPVLYRQERVGRHGRTFTVLKFRSMRDGAEEEQVALAGRNEAAGPLFKIRRDPRVTPVGRILRRLSLDELPQLLNVLNGSMSLVGPRPALPSEVAQYPAHVHRRHAVRPGLTGLAQVSGRSDLPWAETVRLDLHYVDNRSAWLDLSILLRTVPAVLLGRGAY